MADKQTLSTRQRQLREAEEAAQAGRSHGDPAKDLVVPGPGQFPGEATDEPTDVRDVVVRQTPGVEAAERAEKDAEKARKAEQ